jgi:broad specificity phosphatase PhoE
LDFPPTREEEMMTHLYLIRHAESQEEIQKVIGDLPLTSYGMQQIDLLSQRLLETREIQPDIMFSSPLQRAKDTAEKLAAVWGVSVVIEPGLAKWMPPQAEGLHFDAFKRAYGSNPFHAHPSFPVDETWAHYLVRVYSTFDRLLSVYDGKTIVVITHRGVIECAYFYLQGMTALQFPPVHYECGYTAICYWQKRSDAFSSGWSLVKHNDATHLQHGDDGGFPGKKGENGNACKR